MTSKNLKSKVIELIDRRMVVCLFSLAILSLLAIKTETRAAIDGIVTITIALFGANAFQRSAQAFAKAKNPQKTE
jgi:hypothetical protein